MSSAFARMIRTGLVLGVAAVALTGCSRTIRIRDLLDRPQEYNGKTVKGQGVPREGAKAKAEGRFESVFSFLGRTMAAIVQSP